MELQHKRRVMERNMEAAAVTAKVTGMEATLNVCFANKNFSDENPKLNLPL